MTRGRPTLTFRTQQHQQLGLFENAVQTPAVGSDDSLSGDQLIQGLLAGWNARRDLGIKPKHASKIVENERDRQEFLLGARMLGLLEPGMTLKPQQYLVADLLAAHDPYFAMLMPRRSTKTTNLFAVGIGRCASRTRYMVAYAQCTTGVKARDRFRKDIVEPLERMTRGMTDDERGFKINRTGGAERVEFANGSVFQVFPPIGAAFRSDAFDLIILDESGEATPDMGTDLLAGALSTFDTRDDAQLVVAGTAAKYRDGNLLWKYLLKGREGIDRTGIIDYSGPDSLTDEELNDWNVVEKLVRAAHPGIRTKAVPDNLTTIETIRERWVDLRAQFPAEYLGVFGTAGAVVGIADFGKWKAGGSDAALPAIPPARWGLGIAVHPNQTSASIVAAWRVRNRVKLLLVNYKITPSRDVSWVVTEAARLGRKYRMPIVHDTNGPVTVEVESIQRMKPRPQTDPQNFPDVKTSAALIIKEIAAGNVDHWNQDPLTEAVKLAVKRSVGPTAWALGRVTDTDDITPLEAAAIALHSYDENKGRKHHRPPQTQAKAA